MPRPASTNQLQRGLGGLPPVRQDASPSKQRDIITARFRRDLFIELIGDHPSTPTTLRLQAYVHLLSCGCRRGRSRKDWTAVRSSTTIGTSSQAVEAINLPGRICQRHRDDDAPPYEGARLFRSFCWCENSLSRDGGREAAVGDPGGGKISSVFRIGVASRLIDEAMLPLLAT